MERVVLDMPSLSKISTLEISRYQPSLQEKWDEFVAKSKNGTFLFFRDYMDYHASRFFDHSLILTERGKILAMLPAHRDGATLISHNGLTYGGFIADERMTVGKMALVFDTMREWLLAHGFLRFVYKTVPAIYFDAPAEEDLYALFRHDARLYRRDVWLVIDYSRPLAFQQRRERAIKKARQRRSTVRETEDFTHFWKILERNLYARYGCRPVHSLAEIELLHRRFPENIRLFASYADDAMQAGVVVYVSDHVAHIQYMARRDEQDSGGALDLVISHLIEHFRSSKKFFDFGCATEENGHRLNAGLAEYKEGFGARTVVHDFYEWELV